MQTHQDVWWSVSDQEEHAYFRAFNQPDPILEFTPWPIKVQSIVFADGSSLFSAGGAGVGAGQTPWQQNINGNGYNLSSVNNISAGNGYFTGELVSGFVNTSEVNVDGDITILGNLEGSQGLFHGQVTCSFLNSSGINVVGNVDITGQYRINGFPISTGAIISASAPSTSTNANGALWFDTNSLSLNVLYNGSWVQV
jgi:hypothetical protein